MSNSCYQVKIVQKRIRPIVFLNENLHHKVKEARTTYKFVPEVLFLYLKIFRET